MNGNLRLPIRRLVGASALALSLAAPVLAQSPYTPVADEFTGGLYAAPSGGTAIYPGSAATISGYGLIPGQEITLMRGNTVLNPDGPLIANDEGEVSFDLTVDEEAALGLQPIVAIAENPAAATVFELKVSPQVPLSGEDLFEIASQPVVPGLYQVIHNEASDALYVTSSVGRPPISQSELVKLSPETLEIVGRVTPPAAPARPDGSDGGLFGVYGVWVDDTNGHVWATTTRQDSLAVYDKDDLSLVKQFDPGSVTHPRDVVIDEGRGRAYVSTSFTKTINVFDTNSLEPLDPIEITSTVRGEEFGARSIAVYPEAGKLFSASLNTPEVAVVDLDSGEVRVLPLPGAKASSDAAYDPQDGLIFVASQASDNLLIVSEETGEVLHDVTVGAGALSVAFEPVSRRAFVANRGAGTITVVNTDGEIVANLEAGSYPNHVRADGKGNVWAVNKSQGQDDPNGDRIWRITAVAR